MKKEVTPLKGGGGENYPSSFRIKRGEIRETVQDLSSGQTKTVEGEAVSREKAGIASSEKGLDAGIKDRTKA